MYGPQKFFEEKILIIYFPLSHNEVQWILLAFMGEELSDDLRMLQKNLKDM